MVPAQHGHGGHELGIAPVAGTGWLQLLLVVGAQVVVAQALLRPFLPALARPERLVVTGAAAVVVVLSLLGDGIDAPPQAAPAALVAVAVPLFAAHRPDRPMSVLAGRAAPAVVLAAAVAAAVELVRAALAAGAPSEVLVRTGVLVGVVGLSWLVLCRSAPHGSPPHRAALRTATAVHVLGLALGHAVLAGTALLAVTGAPT